MRIFKPVYRLALALVALTTACGAPPPPAASFVARFNPAKGELAEGLFVVKERAYVGLAGLGKIVTVDLTSGAVADFGSVPVPPPSQGAMYGVTADVAGNVYATVAGPGAGVYKIPAAGGAVKTPWATAPAMRWPNGLVFDDKGDLFISDSMGAIFKVTPAGAVSSWLADPSLVGVGAGQCDPQLPLGANGIVRSGDAFYVANTGLAKIVKIPVQADGSAGTPSTFVVPDCASLRVLDGLAVDTDGSILAAVNAADKVVRITADGAVKDLLSGAPLDNPASLAIATVGGKKTLYITNSSFFNQTGPAPGLVAYSLP